MEKHHNGCRDLKDANSRDISFSHKNSFRCSLQDSG